MTRNDVGLRLSATTLETFRLVVDEPWSGVTEEELLANIRGAYQPTRRVARGQAYNRILEAPDAHRQPGGAYRITLGEDYAPVDRTWSWDACDVEPAIAPIDYRLGRFEVKGTKRYGPHRVVAKCDYLHCTRALVEFKVTESTRDPLEKYSPSMQWRFMAEIFRPATLAYRVFRMNARHQLRAITEVDVDVDYPGRTEECAAHVARFVQWATRRGVTEFLVDHQVGPDLDGPTFEDAPVVSKKPRPAFLAQWRPAPIAVATPVSQTSQTSPTRERARPLFDVPIVNEALQPIAPLPPSSLVLRRPPRALRQAALSF